MADRNLTAEQRRIIHFINEKAKELGKCPEKNDMTQQELVRIRRAFGKWVYALEASGQRTPSETTLQRRRNKKMKWKRKHRKGHLPKEDGASSGCDGKNDTMQQKRE